MLIRDKIEGAFPFVLFFFTALTLSSHLYAQEDDAEVMILIAPKQDESEFVRIAESIRAHLIGTNVRLVSHWVDEMPARLPQQEQIAASITAQHHALAVIWVDVVEGERAYLHLSVKTSYKVIVRRLDGTGKEGMADAVALICRSAVDTMLAGGAIGIARPEADGSTARDDPSEENRAQKPHVERKVRFMADVAYGMRVPSTSLGIVHGAGFTVSAVFASHLRVEVGYYFEEPLKDSNENVMLELRRHPITLGAAGRVSRGRVTFDVGATLGFDYLMRTPHVFGSQVVVSEPYGEWVVSAIPEIRLEVRIASALALFVSAGAEVFFSRHRFEFDDEAVFFTDLWLVQPVFRLGGSFLL